MIEIYMLMVEAICLLVIAWHWNYEREKERYRKLETIRATLIKPPIFTEETLERFYAKEIPCIWCGAPINKQELPIFEEGDNGDMIRKWKCLVCGKGFYCENISELQKLGLL